MNDGDAALKPTGELGKDESAVAVCGNHKIKRSCDDEDVYAVFLAGFVRVDKLEDGFCGVSDTYKQTLILTKMDLAVVTKSSRLLA